MRVEKSSNSRAVSTQSDSARQELSVTPDVLRRSSTCLETFVRGCMCRDETLLTQFDGFLFGRGSTENTRRAYHTDVYQALVVKLFYQYDLPRAFDRAAALLVALHGTQMLDARLAQGSTSLEEAERQLSSLILRWNECGVSTMTSPELPLVLADARPFALSVTDERVSMALRATPRARSVVGPTIAKTDRVMIDCFVAALHEELTAAFWSHIISVASISGIMTHLKLMGSDENTIARKMSSLRVFESFLFSRGLLAAPVVSFMRSPRIVPKAQVSLSGDQIQQIKNLLDKRVAITRLSGSDNERYQALRNRALFGVAHYTGIRAQALCGLTIGDFNNKEKELLVREKGRKEMVKPIDGWALRWLREYLEGREQDIRRLKVANKDSAHLFFTRHGLPLRPRSLGRIFAETARLAGVQVSVGQRSTFGPHADRRSRARELKENGASIEEISAFLGHRHINTTEIYLRGSTVDERAMLKRCDKSRERDEGRRRE